MSKKSLQNKVYRIGIVEKLKADTAPEKYAQFKFKELGYLVLNWAYEKDFNKHKIWNWHGFITPEQLKNRLGEKQYAKFCQGKREFVIQGVKKETPLSERKSP